MTDGAPRLAVLAQDELLVQGAHGAALGNSLSLMPGGHNS